MSKNIIICCDGTGNQLNETYSNVIKLYMCLEKDPKSQMTFYDPGVGTMSDPNVVTPLYKAISKIGGLAFGWGLKQNVQEAYTYLMDYYEAGDKIFMFGFSRGAYTARVLCGMIHAVGLLSRGSSHLFPYAWKTFKSCINKNGYQVALQFKTVYAQKVPIHFVGIWDTVSSVGIFGLKVYPYTAKNHSVKNMRHAVAIDECRSYYRQNLFTKTSAAQNIKQVWFAGVHSDAGGSYPLQDSGLAQITLQWMLEEAVDFGLRINNEKVEEILNDSKNKGWSKPDVNGTLHNSLTFFWWILEFLPRLKRRKPWIKLPGLGKPRDLYNDSMKQKKIIPLLHWSVLKRMEGPRNYLPRNIKPEMYEVEQPRSKM